MASHRLFLLLRHPWKLFNFSWTLSRHLTIALLQRLLFPFACHPISFHTEISRCYLAASLSCFLELTFSAPSCISTDDFEDIKLNDVPAILVPRGTRLENLTSDEKERTAVLLYAHGGGYLFGEPLMYIAAYKRWVKEAEAENLRLIVISVDYRLTTTDKFPAYRDDFLSSYRSLILDKGFSPDRIFFGGDSAGGNLCAISGLHAPRSELASPAGLILMSPWLNLTHEHTLFSPAMRTDFLTTFSVANPMLVEYLLPDGLTASDPQISPVFDDLSSLPPQIVFAGTAEVLLPDSIEWVRRSQAAGNDVQFVLDQGQVHMYTLGRPFSNKTIETRTDKRVIKFIKDIISTKSI